jgi:MFS family permease
LADDAELNLAALSVAAPARITQLLLLTLATAAAAFGRSALGPLQESMRIALELSDNQIALLQGPALALPVAVAAVPLGLAIDRYSRARLLVLLSTVGAIGSLSTGLCSGFAALFALRCLVGLTTVATAMAAFSMLGDLCPPDRRGRATMVMGWGQVAGQSGAFALGGTLLAMSSTAMDGWRIAMLWMSAPLALVALSMLRVREPPRVGIRIQNSSSRRALAELWEYRTLVMPLVAGTILVAIADGAALIWSAPMLSRGFMLPPERIGAIMATGLLVMGLVGPIIGGTLADFCQRTAGPRRTMLALSGMACLSVPAGLFAVAPNVAAAGILLFIFLIVGSASGTMVMTLFTLVVPNELRGLSMTLVAATGALFGMGAAPLIISVLSGVLGGTAKLGVALAVVCSTTSAVGAWVLWFGGRRFPLRSAA